MSDDKWSGFANFAPPPKLPDLTKAEWCVILDAMNGHSIMTDSRGAPLLSYRHECIPNVADAIAHGQLDLKWHVHGETLLEKLRALNAYEWGLVREVVDGWWSAPPRYRDDVPGR